MTTPPITASRWLPTGAAALALGVSTDSLKRYATRHEILIEGKHYRRGAFANSPIVWDVAACLEALTHRGMNRPTRREVA
jgi:hypothetical protein